jgi:DNA polymerase-3 subunit epsilon
LRWFSQRIRANTQSWPGYTAYCAQTAESRLLADFHTAGYPDPATPIEDVPLVAMDMETTGLDPSHDGILSIALVPFSIRRIPLSERRYWLVKPFQEVLSSQSIVLHHITHSDIAAAPDLAAVLEGLLGTMAGRIPVVHYRNLERTFLDAAIRARLGEGLLFPVIDTMGLEAERYRFSFRSRFLKWLGREPVSIRLGDSRRRYGLPVYHGHHALRDAIATAELFQAQIAWRFRPDTPLGRLWY